MTSPEIKTLNQYLNEHGATGKDMEALATKFGTTAGQLAQIKYGHRRPGVTLAIAIERETAGQVPVEVTRPDIQWEVIRGKPFLRPEPLANSNTEDQ